MKILLLGASGFLGSILYQKLTNEKWCDVLGTYFHEKNNPDLINLDLLKKNIVEDVVYSFCPDIIIWSVKDMTNEDSLTEYGLNNLLKCIQKKCKIIYISTNVFNDGVGNKKENDEPNYVDNGHAAYNYVSAKIKAEKMLYPLGKHVIVRPGVIYGKDFKGNWDYRISNMINQIKSDKYIKISKNKLSTWVDVNFLADSLISIILSNFVGIIHVGSDQKESGYSINKRIAKELGLKIELILPLENDDVIFDNSYNLEFFEQMFK